MVDSPYIMSARSSLYLGEQATLGAAVAPAKELWAPGATVQTVRGEHQVPTTQQGSIAGEDAPSIQTALSGAVQWNIPGDVNSMIAVLSACLGPPTITTPEGGTSTRLYTWEGNPVNGENPDIYTFDLVERDGGSTQVTRRFQMHDALCTGFTLASDVGDSPMSVQSNWVGNDPTEGATTPGLGTPDRLAAVRLPAATGRVYIDDDWAGMTGNSPTDAADVFNANIVMESGVSPARRQNGEYAFDRVSVGPRRLNMTLGIRKSTAASGLWRTELDHVGSQTLRYVLYENVGPTIEGSLNYFVRIGAAMRHSRAASIPDRGTPDDGGRATTNMVLRSARGANATNVPRDIYAQVQTDQTSFP